MAAKAWLSQRQVPFRTVDINRDEEARHALASMGVSRLPVLFAKGQWIAGFQPDRYAEVFGP